MSLNIVPPRHEVVNSSLTTKQKVINALLGMPAAGCVGGMMTTLSNGPMTLQRF